MSWRIEILTQIEEYERLKEEWEPLIEELERYVKPNSENILRNITTDVTTLRLSEEEINHYVAELKKRLKYYGIVSIDKTIIFNLFENLVKAKRYQRGRVRLRRKTLRKRSMSKATYEGMLNIYYSFLNQ